MIFQSLLYFVIKNKEHQKRSGGAKTILDEARFCFFGADDGVGAKATKEIRLKFFRLCGIFEKRMFVLRTDDEKFD